MHILRYLGQTTVQRGDRLRLKKHYTDDVLEGVVEDILEKGQVVLRLPDREQMVISNYQASRVYLVESVVSLLSSSSV